MADRRIRVVIVDDVELYRDRLKLALERLGILKDSEVREAQTSWGAIEVCDDFHPDVVFLDLKLDPGDRTGQSGEALLKRLTQEVGGPDVIIITELEDESVIRQSKRDGACRYLTKPINEEKIALALKATLDRLGRDLAYVTPPLPEALGETIRKIARWDIPVLVQGPTGAGKELVAREIHRQSERKGTFVAVQMDAIAKGFLEAELLGWVRGGHSQATAERAGLIEHAHGGTLFLDEIGELPLEFQPKLLRVLEEKRVRRLGENKERSVDFRLLAATNRNIRREVAEGRFREDLYFRLAGRTIEVPPLHTRPDYCDWIVPRLIREFEEKYEVKVFAVSTPALQSLRGYSWPGGVRQFRRVIENAIIEAAVEPASPGRMVIQAEHIQLPTQVADLATTLDPDLVTALSRRQTLQENCRLMAQNQVRLLEAEGLRWPAITRIMGIGRATYFRIKAGKWPPEPPPLKG